MEGKTEERRVVGAEGEEREPYVMNVHDPSGNVKAPKQESTMR